MNCSTSQWYQPPLPDNFTSSDVDCNDDAWASSTGCATEYCDSLTDAENQAAVIMSIPYIISAILSPPLGFAVDVYGWRAIIAAIAPAILIIVHLMIGYTDVNIVIPLIGQGLAYTGFVSVLWPAVPLVVEERISGVAFGVVTSAQNLACAVVPLLIASIYSDSNDKYIPNVELLFVAFASVGFVVGLYMNYYDINHGSVLNRSAAEAEAAEAAELEKNSVFSPLIDPVSNENGKPPGIVVNQEGFSRRSSRSSRDSQGGRKISQSRSRNASKDGHSLSFTTHGEMMRGGAYRHPSFSEEQ